MCTNSQWVTSRVWLAELISEAGYLKGDVVLCVIVRKRSTTWLSRFNNNVRVTWPNMRFPNWCQCIQYFFCISNQIFKFFDFDSKIKLAIRGQPPFEFKIETNWVKFEKVLSIFNCQSSVQEKSLVRNAQRIRTSSVGEKTFKLPQLKRTSSSIALSVGFSNHFIVTEIFVRGLVVKWQRTDMDVFETYTRKSILKFKFKFSNSNSQIQV